MTDPTYRRLAEKHGMIPILTSELKVGDVLAAFTGETFKCRRETVRTLKPIDNRISITLVHEDGEDYFSRAADAVTYIFPRDNPKKDNSEKIPAGFKRPFRLCGSGLYIYDDNHRVAADINYRYDLEGRRIEEGEVRARGWGHIQYIPGAEEEFEKWKLWFSAKTEGCQTIEEAINNLNDISPKKDSNMLVNLLKLQTKVATKMTYALAETLIQESALVNKLREEALAVYAAWNEYIEEYGKACEHCTEMLSNEFDWIPSKEDMMEKAKEK